MAMPRRRPHSLGDPDNMDPHSLHFDADSGKWVSIPRYVADYLRKEDNTQQDDGNVWTATRCKRLLRPLRGAIRGFRKEQAMSNNLSRISSDDVDLKIAEPNESAERSADDSVIDDGGDPDFSPQQTAMHRIGKAAATYRTRSRRQSVRDGGRNMNESGDVSFRMEVERNLRALESGTASATMKDLPIDAPHVNVRGTKKGRLGTQSGGGKVSFALESFLKATEMKWPESYRRSLVGYQNALDASRDAALRRVETWSRLTRKDGAQSLFQMCLQQMPKFVAHTQKNLEDEDDDDAEDATNHVFEHLEAYSSSENGGWRSLREVVRSQGLHDLCGAIREGVFTPKMTQSFAEVCLRRDYDRGARLVVDAWADALIEGKLKHLRPVLQLSAIRHTALQADCHNALWNILVRAADDGDASVFSEPVRHLLWNECLDCLVDNDTTRRESAYAWLHRLITFTLTLQTCGLDEIIHSRRLAAAHLTRPGDKSLRSQSADRVVQSSVAAILSALLTRLSKSLFLSDEDSEVGRVEPSISMFSRILGDVELALWSQPSLGVTGSRAAVALMPWLSDKVTSMMHPHNSIMNEHQEQLFRKLARSCENEELVSCLSQHVSIMAIYNGRRAGDGNVKMIAKFTKTLFHSAITGMMEYCDSENIPLLRSVAKVTAQDFAERFPTRATVKLALDVEAEADRMARRIRNAGIGSDERDLMSSPAQVTPGRYRWEESVSEWVARTPCRTASGVSVVVPQHAEDESLALAEIVPRSPGMGLATPRQSGLEDAVLCTRRIRKPARSIESERCEDTFSDFTARSVTPASTVSDSPSRSGQVLRPMVIVPNVSLDTRIATEGTVRRRSMRELKRKSYGEIEAGISSEESASEDEHVSKRLRSRASAARASARLGGHGRNPRNSAAAEDGPGSHRSLERRRNSMPARLHSALAAKRITEMAVEESEDELAL